MQATSRTRPRRGPAVPRILQCPLALPAHPAESCPARTADASRTYECSHARHNGSRDANGPSSDEMVLDLSDRLTLRAAVVDRDLGSWLDRSIVSTSHSPARSMSLKFVIHDMRVGKARPGGGAESARPRPLDQSISATKRLTCICAGFPSAGQPIPRLA